MKKHRFALPGRGKPMLSLFCTKHVALIYNKFQERKAVNTLSAKELSNLINWLRAHGFPDEKISECLEFVEGKKKVFTEDE